MNNKFDLKKYIEESFYLGKCVVVMPQRGVFYDEGYFTEDGVTFCHKNTILKLDEIIETFDLRSNPNSIAHISSLLTGISSESFLNHSLAIFSYETELVDSIYNGFHVESFIQRSSEIIFNALNLARLLFCKLSVDEGLPHLPGYWFESKGYLGALILRSDRTQEYLATKRNDGYTSNALGIGLDEYDIRRLQDNSYFDSLYLHSHHKVGSMIRHGLRMYSRALYANSDTLKFINIIALFEYLANGGQYSGGFEKVRKKLQAHIAKSKDEYDELADIFQQLTSKKVDGVNTGYRTRIIHEGAFIEEILETTKERKHLFDSLDDYVKRIIDSLTPISTYTIEELGTHRKELMKSLGIKT